MAEDMMLNDIRKALVGKWYKFLDPWEGIYRITDVKRVKDGTQYGHIELDVLYAGGSRAGQTNQHPLTSMIGDAPATPEEIQRAQEGRLAQKAVVPKGKTICNSWGVPITGPKAEKIRALFPTETPEGGL